jgi:hypothetical protein
MEPEGAGIREAIRYDVARVLVRGALQNEEFASGPPTYEEDTVGAILRRMLTTYFPWKTVQGLRQMLQENPDQLDCLLQDSLRLFKEN